LALDPPDALIKRLSGEVIDRIKVDKEMQAGDFKKLSDFVDATVMPHVNFQRMTALAVGRNWRSANPDQQKQLMTNSAVLLLRTYSGALGSVKDQSIRIKPLRADPADTEVIVRSEVVQPRGEPIQLDYRLEKAQRRLEDLRRQCAGRLAGRNLSWPVRAGSRARGIDGLVKSLTDKNKSFDPARKP
jgi:phospholipid transport system substrate-binding protein